ncbi:MAG: tetratricopeptide repeat protein [Roseovarius sp.]|nr:tetratricopeptide repeat protein [Roseovarius sp.]
MARLAAVLMTSLAVAACGPAPAPDGPFAPGTARDGAAVDGLVVGHRLVAAGEYELAIDAFSRAALDHGMTADVMAGLGSAHLHLGRLGTAEKLLRDAVDKEDATPETWNNLGVILMEQGETAEAEQVFRRAYALDDGESDAIRDNLRLALAKSQKSLYDGGNDQGYKLVRRGSSDYLIREIP